MDRRAAFFVGFVCIVIAGVGGQSPATSPSSTPNTLSPPTQSSPPSGAPPPATTTAPPTPAATSPPPVTQSPPPAATPPPVSAPPPATPPPVSSPPPASPPPATPPPATPPPATPPPATPPPATPPPATPPPAVPPPAPLASPPASVPAPAQSKKKVKSPAPSPLGLSPPAPPTDAPAPSLLGTAAPGPAQNDDMQYLYVRVVKAKDLPAKDVTGSCDPYVEVKLGNYKGTTRHFEKKTNPEWNQVFAFSKDRLQASLLEVTVKDKDLVNDDFIGRIQFDLSEVPKRVPPDSPLAPLWYRLEDRKSENVKGELMLAVWMGTQADEAFPEAWNSDASGVTGVDGLANIVIS